MNMIGMKIYFSEFALNSAFTFLYFELLNFFLQSKSHFLNISFSKSEALKFQGIFKIFASNRDSS